MSTTPTDTREVLGAALLDTENAAAYCGMSRSTFDHLAAQGSIGPKPIRFTKRTVLWSRAELDQWIAKGCPSRTQWERQKDHRVAGTSR